MRKTTSLAISMSAAFVAAVEVTLSPAPQNASFVWALANEEGDHPGYRRVESGALDDGTKLFICRAGYTPGR
jgi:hypothetical protein